MEAKDFKGYNILKHTFGLFHSVRGSKLWKNIISPKHIKNYGGTEALLKSLKELPKEILESKPLDE